jgi:hypothetical protein
VQYVEHKTYGKGRICKERFGGFELYVEFEDGISRWVRRDEVEFIGKLMPEKTASVLSDEKFKARQMIESLRMGIVPHDYVEEFTFGREKEIQKIKNWLNEIRGGFYIIIGEYGSGKTHLLEYIRSISLEEGWATARAEIGQEEGSFHRPYQVYQQIARSFKCRIEGRTLGFREFLREIVNNDKSYHLEGHEYLNKLQEELRKREREIYQTLSEEPVWEWIEGERDYGKLRMYKAGTAANIYCYILNGISWSAHEILGLKGLLVLFDEAENIIEANYQYQLEKGKNFLRGLFMLAENNSDLLEERIENLWGSKTGLRYHGFGQIRFAWRLPSYLKVILAFTPPWKDYENKLNIKVTKENTLNIEPLDENALKKIFDKIISLYKEAHNHIDLSEVDKLIEYIPRGKTRLFIKGIIEALDLKRFYPEKSWGELLR